MLRLEGLAVSYGAVRALAGVSIEVRAGEIVTLLGSNGAGKSTLLKAMSGLVPVQHGRILYRRDGEEVDLARVAAHRIVGLGVAHVPEGRRVFASLTVLENLEMGAFLRRDAAGIRADLDEVFQLFPRLAERKSQRAETLSGGEQQMLAIGRALMSRPRVLLMDEPSLGIAPLLVKTIFETIRDINVQRRTTIVVVEQNARVALGIAHRGYVLEVGEIVLAGTSAELAGNDEVRKAYLGG
ncbi:MAG: ABC transporter ATP-binding protein [bacterium]